MTVEDWLQSNNWRQSCPLISTADDYLLSIDEIGYSDDGLIVSYGMRQATEVQIWRFLRQKLPDVLKQEVVKVESGLRSKIICNHSLRSIAFDILRVVIIIGIFTIGLLVGASL